ncbi:MAG: hypothetical protein E7259_05510 [Lachnospiraceae bacterium]|nr:hypothetical protein [Lachnospiraceae bacterium]
MKKIYLRNCMYSFFVFFIFILLFGMALKNKNNTLCSYDLVLCCTTYAYITIYILIPYIFMKRKRNEWNPYILVRYRNVDMIWLKGCKDAIVWAVEITVCILVSILLSSLIVTDSLCDWTNQNSIFVNYTQYEITQFPAISKIVIPAASIIYFNVLWIEILTFLGYWYTNMYWTGYIFVVLLYVLPKLPWLPVQISGLGLFYSDYCGNQSIFMICIKRIGEIVCLIMVMVVLGLFRRKKDFVKA